MVLIHSTRSPAAVHPVKARLCAAGAAVVTVGLGLGIRAAASGGVAKYGGDALYTVLLCTLFVLVAPRIAPLKAAAAAACLVHTALRSRRPPGRP